MCEECGLVHLENHIDHGPEWRAFDADQKKKRTRTGAPMTNMIHDKGLSTMIGWTNRDIFGKETPIIGFYTYGEQAPLGARIHLGQTLFHNETIVIFAIGE